MRLSEAQKDQSALTYQQAIQGAFREVSDALIAYKKDQDFRKQQELLTDAAKDASRLSNLRYKGAAASYLKVLDAETRQYAAELTLAQARSNRDARLRPALSRTTEGVGNSKKLQQKVPKMQIVPTKNSACMETLCL